MSEVDVYEPVTELGGTVVCTAATERTALVQSATGRPALSLNLVGTPGFAGAPDSGCR
jgi:hypothetical protein